MEGDCIFGYEGWKLLLTGSDFFSSRNKHKLVRGPLGSSSKKENGSVWITEESAPAVKTIVNAWSLSGYAAFESSDKELVMPDKNDRLYVMRHSKIPHNVLREQFKTVKSMKDADCVVLCPTSVGHGTGMAVFRHEKTKSVILIDNCVTGCGFTTLDFILGETLQELVERYCSSLDGSDIKYMDAVCVYIGGLICISKSDYDAIEFLTQYYDKRATLDKDLMASLVSEREKLSADGLVTLYHQMTSTDDDTVWLGMRALCATNYMQSQCCVRWLLYRTEAEWKRMLSKRNCKEFDYMLEMLDLSSGYIPRMCFSSLTKEEYEDNEDAILRIIAIEADEAVSERLNSLSLNTLLSWISGSLEITYNEKMNKEKKTF